MIERTILNDTAQAIMAVNRLDASMRFIRGATDFTPGGVRYTKPARIAACRGYKITDSSRSIDAYLDVEIPLEEIVVDGQYGEVRIAPAYKISLRAYVSQKVQTRTHLYHTLGGLNAGQGLFLYALSHPVWFLSVAYGSGYGFRWTHEDSDQYILKQQEAKGSDCENTMIPLHVSHCTKIEELTSAPMIKPDPDQQDGRHPGRVVEADPHLVENRVAACMNLIMEHVKDGALLAVSDHVRASHYLIRNRMAEEVWERQGRIDRATEMLTAGRPYGDIQLVLKGK